jgi:hypothetical protein
MIGIAEASRTNANTARVSAKVTSWLAMPTKRIAANTTANTES